MLRLGSSRHTSRIRNEKEFECALSADTSGHNRSRRLVFYRKGLSTISGSRQYRRQLADMARVVDREGAATVGGANECESDICKTLSSLVLRRFIGQTVLFDYEILKR